MKEKIFYLVGDTLNGRFHRRFTSYEAAMEYIKSEYITDANDRNSTFIDGYYGIYKISEETAEYYGWDYVYSDWHTTEFLGEVSYEQAMNYERTGE